VAYLTKDARGRSPYWLANYCTVEADGVRRWVRKSTKKTKKAAAQEVLDGLQKTADQAAAGVLTDARVRKIVYEIVERTTGKKVNAPTTRQWLDQWIRLEKGAVAPGTLNRYQQVARNLTDDLGSKADAPLERLTTDDFLKFKENRLKAGLSPRGVNLLIKILRRPFKIAVDEGRLDRNPAAAVRTMKTSAARKGIFSPAQVTQLIEAAKGDWKGLVLLAYFTGGRLGDLARLRWESVNLNDRTIEFAQKKTGAAVKIPIHSDLESYLLKRTELTANDRQRLTKKRPSGPLFRELHDKPGSGKSGLSMAFKRIMTSAGIKDEVSRKRGGEEGRSVSLLSFHSLRHSFNSAMANAGVAPEVRQLLTGHASLEMNKVYTHYEFASVRKAVSSIASLNGEKADG
jgi:integrase